jgi:hypothetical protein
MPGKRRPECAKLLRITVDRGFLARFRAANRLTTGQPLSRPAVLAMTRAMPDYDVRLTRGLPDYDRQTVRRPLTKPTTNSTSAITSNT